jgi:hypothetical protein
MTTANLLKLVELLVWPAVAVSTLLILRPLLPVVLRGARIKISIGGQEIETTLPELQQAIEEQAGEILDDKHIAYLRHLKAGTRHYPEGTMTDDEKAFLRPLRNNGLILTNPRDVYLRDAKDALNNRISSPRDAWRSLPSCSARVSARFVRRNRSNVHLAACLPPPTCSIDSLRTDLPIQ